MAGILGSASRMNILILGFVLLSIILLILGIAALALPDDDGSNFLGKNNTNSIIITSVGGVVLVLCIIVSLMVGSPKKKNLPLTNKNREMNRIAALNVGPESYGGGRRRR